ncbi:hypothetical protein P4H27_00610 [Paenibacillus taichungensis]|uniref:Uncharacterized protein n=2 Tax=Paenibacillus TaxID=44249 RepID=A0ABX9BK60_9BACL|nr:MULTISPECIES: hypothetical protein [Paenibacillus]MCZ1264473.1 hypothetical protein [Paenibacillus tundrae]MDR9748834.1 hypothetical protein [Paenibacillus taichungensis]MEC0105434.1 hypothetical protein [Paenibacillus taichungensis]MEC0200510.1 hypothetical protein [Paenibacillus taichungensis]NEU64301.1 hypothetical protein [Paenibacillus sp. ALJ109b]
MSYICPLCNGLVVPEQACPHCLQGLSECGKLDDYTGPYSPYVIHTSSDTADEAENVCNHMMYCHHCQTSTLWPVNLWDMSGNL